MTGLSLGIDIGTSGIRTAVVDAEGQVLAMAREPHEAQDPDQIDARAWWRSAQTCIRNQCDALIQAGHDPNRITTAAVDGTSGTMVLTDADLKPVTRAFMYNSKGFCAEAEQIARVAPSAHITQGSGSALARAMRLMAEDTDNQAAHLLHQADYISACLMGYGGHSDHNNALKTGYDPEAESWPGFLPQLDILVDLLPQVHAAGAPLDLISPKAAANLGLPVQTRIHAGTTDSIAAFFACAPMQEGAAVTSLGTTLAIKILSATRIDDPTIGLYSHKVGAHWLVGGASNTGGGALKTLFTQDELIALSNEIDPLRASDLDYYPLSQPGERFPISDTNLPPRITPRPESDVDYLHGLLESIARIEAQCYDAIVGRGGSAPLTLFTAGGGASNSTWTAIRERVLGLKITQAEETEAAIGAARLPQRRWSANTISSA